MISWVIYVLIFGGGDCGSDSGRVIFGGDIRLPGTILYIDRIQGMAEMGIPSRCRHGEGTWRQATMDMVRLSIADS